MSTASTPTTATARLTRGSRPGDIRIRRERPARPSLIGRIASRLRDALPR